MLVNQKIKTIKFSKENYKNSFLEASKFAAGLIKTKKKLMFNYEKDTDCKSILLTIYYAYDEKDLAHHRCSVCKEFQKHFYFNNEISCNSCKMVAYRKELAHEIKRLGLLVSKELKLNDKCSDDET